MLTAEEAQTRLGALRADGWRDGAAERSRTLAPRLRDHVGVLTREVTWHQATNAEQRAALLRAFDAVERAGDRDRRRMLEAAHPGLGATLATWWVRSATQPYPAGFNRRAFRAPNDPALTVATRGMRLVRLLHGLGPYPSADAGWLAAWGSYLEMSELEVGGVLATAIDAGGPAGDAVFDTLVACASGEHPVGRMGRHVVVGLWRSARVDGWELVERMLLAAQRQEGLRSAILESADEAHPDAFRRLLRLIVDHDLLRFAATIRAVAVWIGCELDVERKKDAAAFVGQLAEDLSSESSRRAGLASEDGVRVCVALLASAMEDAVATIPVAREVLRRGGPDARTAAALVLSQLGLDAAYEALLPALADEDVRVAWLAFVARRARSDRRVPDRFDALLDLAARLPEPSADVGPFVFAGSVRSVGRGPVLQAAIRERGDRPLDALLPWVPRMDAFTRALYAREAAEAPSISRAVRAALLTLTGDRSSRVRHAALAALAEHRIAAAEAPALEALLTRQATDLRRGVIGLLRTLGTERAIESAARLRDAGDASRRDAACELLGSLPPDAAVAQLAQAFVDAGVSEPQRELLQAALPQQTGSADPLGSVYDAARRTPAVQPAFPSDWTDFVTDAAARIPGAVDDVLHEYRDTEVQVTTWRGSTDMLLADVRWVHDPLVRRVPRAGADPGASRMVLEDVFRPWWAERTAEHRDADGQEAVRALAAVLASERERFWLPNGQRTGEHWSVRTVRELLGPASIGELRHPHLVAHVLAWLVYDEADATTVDLCLGGTEAVLARVPESAVDLLAEAGERADWRVLQDDFRGRVSQSPWIRLATAFEESRRHLFDRDRLARLFRCVRWLDEPRPGVRRAFGRERLVLRAHLAGVATDDDLVDAFLAPRNRLFPELTLRRRPAAEHDYPDAVRLADATRAAIVETELARGDLPTPASGAVASISSVEGADLVARVLHRLGKASIQRGYIHGDSRTATFSHLLRVSYPAPSDTADSVASAFRRHEVGERRMVELAVYSPQWSRLVGEVLGWDGFADAVWWLHAHTKDERWSVNPEVKETWAALSAEQTALTASDLTDGAVDVEWFWRVHRTLGPERWAKLLRAAKLASGGNGHRRAVTFAEALLGTVSEDTVLERITSKRNQDAVRALGLLPLPDADPERRERLLRRYQALREFERGAAKFGSQRRTSERTAVRIGIENLARAAGFDDPQRFSWAMEAHEIADLASGPLVVDADDVSVALHIDADGLPQLDIARGGRPLKAVPAKLRKAPAIEALRERKAVLGKQVTRVRRTLEEAMVRGDTFDVDELRALDRHPLVAPMLALLVLLDADGRTTRVAGCGTADGLDVPAGAAPPFRIAHPADLEAERCWASWQQRLFAEGRRQPFKQVFRELYVVTETERRNGPLSFRYEGHQVQPRQARALLGARGWNGDHDAGVMSRVFHHSGIVARLDFLDGFLTAAEVELPTLRSVWFTRRGELDALPLDSVPRIVFSEAMRDLDLVVSVAHAGAVDPEASASTVEMRTALERETARVMKLDNVRFVGNHAVIDGRLGEYSLHLGSGIVHRRPGGAVFVIPVHSQRRGRLFLPFADDDPKTAEVLSKLLLFARDDEMRDPTVLEQLRAG